MQCSNTFIDSLCLLCPLHIPSLTALPTNPAAACTATPGCVVVPRVGTKNAADLCVSQHFNGLSKQQMNKFMYDLTLAEPSVVGSCDGACWMRQVGGVAVAVFVFVIVAVFVVLWWATHSCVMLLCCSVVTFSVLTPPPAADLCSCHHAAAHASLCACHPPCSPDAPTHQALLCHHTVGADSCSQLSFCRAMGDSCVPKLYAQDHFGSTVQEYLVRLLFGAWCFCLTC